jgi:RimK family alpha-L-glutamate ligase
MGSDKVLNFWGFLNEAESKGESVKVVVMSGNTGGSKTSKSFEKVCKRRGLECHTVDINNVVLEKVYNGHVLKSEEESISIDPNSTVIVPRRGVIENSYTKQIMNTLEESRYFTINTLQSIEICENKFVTSHVLEEAGLPVPKFALVPNEEALDSALEEIGGTFPLVMKLLSGTQGIGVSIVDSYASYKSVYQTIRKLDDSSEILIQEKIDSNFDLRIQVIVKKFDPINPEKDNCIILGSMKREAVKKDFRTNYSLGGQVSEFKIDDKIRDIACRAANAVGCHWCGVDIMIDKKTKNPYILEVNSSPGTEGISKAIGKPIVNDVIDYITDKENWNFATLEAGYLEKIEVPGIGEMVAKFDTGNGSTSCSIHADSIEEKGKKLTWSCGDKKFVSDIIGYSDAEVGKNTDRRPVIEMDIIFNDVRVPKVKISPVDRTGKSTPFLANRVLMRKLGMIVNPNKAFVITDMPEDDYSPKSAKGQEHAGIYFKIKNK